MKLLNKKGFILVETLIVTLFVVTLFILVYQNLVPSIGEYETMNNYDDVDSVYASNLFKENLLRYGNMNYIDSYLSSASYLDITDCNNINVYKNSQYCKKIKKSLSILEEDLDKDGVIEENERDYIFITKYDISNFRDTVKKEEKFDSGKLSNFRSYLATVSDTDSFYDETSGSSIAGKYRLFMTRTVTNADQTTTLKYVNLGIYDGKYKRYNMGETVTFAPGTSTGNMTFYVLKTSTSSESTVTLILNKNIGTSTNFNSTGTAVSPDSALIILNNSTSRWNNVNVLTSDDTYTSSHGYTISYDGYRARLLEPNDIYEVFGSKIAENYFDQSNNAFAVEFKNDSSLSFLSNGLTGSNGYWMANMVTDNDEMAWTVQDKKIVPSFIKVGTPTIGVRPVIVVSKSKLK